MKKKFIILITLMIITPFIIYLLFGYFNKSNNISEQFKFDKTQKISKILIIKGLDSLSVEYQNEKPVLNSKFEVRNETLIFFLKTIKTLRIKFPVPKSEIDSIENKINELKHEIFVYSDNEILLHWYIGEYSGKYKATYMRDGENNLPYLVNIPGRANDMTKRFEVSELYWRTDKIFNYSPNEINKISLEYTQKPEKSFVIEKTNDKFLISTKSGILPEEKINKENLNYYFGYYSSVSFDYIFTDISQAKKDSILAVKSEHIIKVTDNKGITKTLKTYLRFNNGQQDLNKLNASINNDKDIVIISYYSIDLILKEPEYFLKINNKP